MGRLIGGIEKSEIQQGWQALSKVQSIDDIEHLLQTMPVFSTPAMHSTLRQEWLAQEKHYGKSVPRYEAIFNCLFMLLHYRVYRQQFELIKYHDEQAVKQKSVVFAPEFFQKVAALLHGNLPDVQGQVLDPKSEEDLKEICDQISAAVGQEVVMPVYQPSPGSHWNAIVVECPSCQRQRLELHAYSIDLMCAPDLIRPLQEGQINNSTCPYCGERLCVPIRVWLQDGPDVLDPLAAISCIWRLNETFFVYQPPPGTKRIEVNDLILEIRCVALQRQVGWDNLVESQDTSKARVERFSFAYTNEELVDYLAEATSVPATYQARRTMIVELGQKLRSGFLSFAEVERHIRTVLPHAARDWPISQAGDPTDPQYGGDVYQFLAASLVCEMVAEVQGVDNYIRTLLALSTVMGYNIVGEIALAESSLARAEDLLMRVPVDFPNREILSSAVANSRAGFLQKIGEYEAATKLHEQVLSGPIFGDHDEGYQKQVAWQEIESDRVLDLYMTHHYAEALEAYPARIRALEQLEQKVRNDTTEEDQESLLASIRHRLSGDLANWASLLTDLADTLRMEAELSEILNQPLSPSSLKDFMSRIEKDSLQQLKALEIAKDALSRAYPTGYEPKTLLEQARILLEQALQISQEIKGWRYASIQAYRLALLLDDLGQSLEAEKVIEKVLKYAKYAGDHKRLSASYAFLALHALGRHDGVRAIEFLSLVTQEEIHEQIRSGYRADGGEKALALGNAAFEAIKYGGDAAQAVLIAESIKAPTTAAALMHGMPIQPNNSETKVANQRLNDLLRQRELLRLHAMSHSDDVATIGAQLSHLQSDINECRRFLSLRDPRFAQWVNASDFGVPDIEGLRRRLLALGSKTTLLGFFPADKGFWVYSIWGEGCIVEKQLYSDQGIISSPQDDKSGKREPLSMRHLRPAEQADGSILEQLSEMLLVPVDARLKELKPEDRLVISPSEALSHIPFCTLLYHGKRLCEQVCISQVQGIGILEACLDRPRRSIQRAVCVGDPKRPDVGSLPGALTEARNIAQLLGNAGKQVTLLEEREATIGRLIETAKECDIMHLACHAYDAKRPGELSMLLLAPDLAFEDSGDFSEDRVISELSLQPGCLVNLVGCNTGRQIWTPILINGLVPSFLIAGATSVIGSLWSLQDKAAFRFQTEFYKHILAGIEPAESLALTQRECIAGRLGKEMQRLEAWAGYVVYGIG